MGVKSNNILHTHVGQLLQGQRTVQHLRVGQLQAEPLFFHRHKDPVAGLGADLDGSQTAYHRTFGDRVKAELYRS